MNAKKLVAFLFATLFIITAAVYVFRYSQLLGHVLSLLPPLLAVIFGAYATRTYRLGSVHGKSMALMTTSLFFFFMGELFFFLFQFVFHTSPFPSVADVFYLAAYPLLLAGLLKEVSFHTVSWRSINKLVLVLILLLLMSLAFIVLYFGVFLAYNPGDSVIKNSIAIGYGIADLLLIIPSLFVLNMALDYRGGKLFNSWGLILLGVMWMMAGDILFAIFNNMYAVLTWPYTLIDLVWIASFLAFAYSFFYTAATIKELDSKLINKAKGS
jgi:hypothetical protein